MSLNLKKRKEKDLQISTLHIFCVECFIPPLENTFAHSSLTFFSNPDQYICRLGM